MNIFPGEQIDLVGNSSIGIFGIATNTYALLPYNTKPHVVQTANEVLGVKVTFASLVQSRLLGIFAVGNSNALLLPHLISESELNHLEQSMTDDVTIGYLESKISALGNSIVASDRVAIVHPDFTREDVHKIQDVLNVEVIPTTLMGNPLVGSLIFRNDHGFLAHPKISDEEITELESIFGIKGDVTTVNRGTPYPRPGIIGNTNGLLVGTDTTGSEMMRIFQVLSP